MGVKNFSSPLPSSKFPRWTPSKLCNYVGLYVLYKPWKFGEGLWSSFFHWPIWKYGTPVWEIHVNILESGVNSWYSFTYVIAWTGPSAITQHTQRESHHIFVTYEAWEHFSISLHPYIAQAPVGYMVDGKSTYMKTYRPILSRGDWATFARKIFRQRPKKLLC